MKNYILLTALFTFSILSYGQVKTLTDDTVASAIENSTKPFIIDFYATWCAPCKIMSPIMEELAEEYKGQVTFYRMDVDANETDDYLGIESIPTFYFIMDGANVGVQEGAITKEKFKDLINENFELTTNAKFDEYSDKEISDKWFDWSSLNLLAWHGYEEHNEAEVLSKCIEIVLRSIQLNENSYNLDTYAALLYKTKEYSKALKQAKKAIEKAIENDEDYTSTTLLVNLIIERL